MSPLHRRRLYALTVFLGLLATAEGQSPIAQERLRALPACLGAYADDLSLASVDARRQNESTRYAYALRSRATYQCPYFDREGNLRRRKETVVAHGTAFALKRDREFTYLVTNEHVTDWPAVSTPEDRVDGIPLGCKRVSDHNWLVDNESDEYDADDIEVQRVLVDSELDLGIVKTTTKLPTLPFRIGTSAGIRAGNAIEVRGFPLGAFSALSTGKITNARQHDDEQGWNHTDMVTDAQLSRGQSGSPVLAVSCATREFELVGVYHAGFREGASLNVAVGIDELRESITTLKPRKRVDPQHGPGAAERARVEASFSSPAAVPYVPFGALTVGVRPGKGGVLLYDVFGKRFPLTDKRLMVIEDQPSSGAFGLAERAWINSSKGLCEIKLAKLDESDRTTFVRTVAALRDHLLRTVRFRDLDASSDKSYARYEKLRSIETEISRTEVARRDLSRGLADLVDRVPNDALGSCLEPAAIATAPHER